MSSENGVSPRTLVQISSYKSLVVSLPHLTATTAPPVSSYAAKTTLSIVIWTHHSIVYLYRGDGIRWRTLNAD